MGYDLKYMYTEEWQSMADFEGAGDRYRKWISEWEKQRAWREIHTLEDGGFFLLAFMSGDSR